MAWPSAAAGSSAPSKKMVRMGMSESFVEGEEVLAHRGIVDHVGLERLARGARGERGKRVLREHATEHVDVHPLDRAARVGGEEVAVVHHYLAPGQADR